MIEPFVVTGMVDRKLRWQPVMVISLKHGSFSGKVMGAYSAMVAERENIGTTQANLVFGRRGLGGSLHWDAFLKN